MNDALHAARRLLIDEINLIVSSAEEQKITFRIGAHAARLAADHPSFSVGRIVDELVLEATRRGGPVEIGRGN